jgi:Putative zinc dependent peptidase (DUF5700)
MKTFVISILSMIMLGSCRPRQENHQLNLGLNYQSADFIFKWFDNQSNDKVLDSILNEPGIQIMEENVRSLSESDANSIKTFKEELQQFDVRDSGSKNTYGIDLAWSMRDKSVKLLEKIKREEINDSIVKRALDFIPLDYPVEAECNIYFVLTGWAWGDAYVCNVKKINGKFRIADEGEPSIVVNLTIMTKLYGETPDDQTKVVYGILAHELFHLAFANYRKLSPNYSRIPEISEVEKLFEIVHNEGIAHYVDKRLEIIEGYETNPKFKEGERQSLHNLSLAFDQLRDSSIAHSEKQNLLRQASVGKYWAKYGAIAGMFMAYHIEKESGKIALSECIRKGPWNFLQQYNNLQQKTAVLPSLSKEMKGLLTIENEPQ